MSAAKRLPGSLLSCFLAPRSRRRDLGRLSKWRIRNNFLLRRGARRHEIRDLGCTPSRAHCLICITHAHHCSICALSLTATYGNSVWTNNIRVELNSLCHCWVSDVTVLLHPQQWNLYNIIILWQITSLTVDFSPVFPGWSQVKCAVLLPTLSLKGT